MRLNGPKLGSASRRELTTLGVANEIAQVRSHRQLAGAAQDARERLRLLSAHLVYSSVLCAKERAMTTAQGDPAATRDQQLRALDAFKDWSNYMLVTTVAALGWLSAEHPHVDPTSFAIKVAIMCLTFSIVFGIFTLAAVPAVMERVNGSKKTFYDVSGKFRLAYVVGPFCPIKLKAVCWPQHVLFIVGLFAYAYAALHPPLQAAITSATHSS
jgi:hypothetical protein